MNFKGWTKASLKNLFVARAEVTAKAPEEPKKRQRKPAKDYVVFISEALHNAGIEHKKEYKFVEDRRFRFDLAIPKYQIAIEFEGGIFSNGRHTRGKGYASDCKKYNLATMYGWRLLRYTTEDTKGKDWAKKIVEEIEQLIISRKK